MAREQALCGSFAGGHAARARESGISNVPEVVDGHLRPSMLPGWGAELDWDYITRYRVEDGA